VAALGGDVGGWLHTVVVYSSTYSTILTSVPTSRATPRREPNLWFRSLNSLLRKFVNIKSICHCSTAIPLSWKPVHNQNYRGVGHAVNHFVDAIDRTFNRSPLLNRNYGSLLEIRSIRRKILLRTNVTPRF
jgi:hypothetical protein